MTACPWCAVARAAFLRVLARRFASATDLGDGCVGVDLTGNEIVTLLACLDDALDPTGEARALLTGALRRLTAEQN